MKIVLGVLTICALTLVDEILFALVAGWVIRYLRNRRAHLVPVKIQ